MYYYCLLLLLLFFFHHTATTAIYTLSLHDALPISKGALTYTDIAGDPVLYGNLPPREISMKDVFRSGDSSKNGKHPDRKSGSAGMPRPISYAVFCLKKKKQYNSSVPQRNRSETRSS